MLNNELSRLCVLSFAFLILAGGSPSLCAQDESKESSGDRSKLNAGSLAAIKLRSVGPAMMSGRIADIAIDPENGNTWYVAAGSGGVWKTKNAGTTWKAIFENYGSYSIGCVTLDGSNRNIVWVGTGENVGGRHVGYGDGIYRSTDGGNSFKNMGLKESEHISKIVVHPHRSDLIYVAVQGPLWSPGGERGLYQSSDGGESWQQILGKGMYTGVTDVVLDPKNPSVLYAATHQRHRTVWALINGGPETGIHKSLDGGKTWRELKGGLPGGDKGKIGLAISPQDSRVIYATIELPGRKGGLWRSANGGESWEKKSDYVGGGTGPHYYQELYADPHRFDVIYQANVYLGRSEDGGKTWKSAESRSKHVDNHAVAFHPSDPDFLLVGCDGGLYRSFDRGKTYDFFSNLPLTQFYKVDVDNDYPFYNIVGGTQDNNTQYGPSRTRSSSGILNHDWKAIIGGDGHDCAIDPKNPNIIYCESQQGHLRRFDRRTGESVDIRPRPEKGAPDLRPNWDSPIHISPHSNTTLFHGSKMVHRSDDRGDSWTAISPDLSRNQNRLTLKVMDRVWSVDATYDFLAMSQYGNVTSLSESPLVEGLIYAGTDDGLIQVTEDGGKNWRRVERIFGIPEFAFVNDIKSDRFDPDTVYAALDNHKEGDFKPYLIRSTDRGRTWKEIGSTLPDRHLVWRIVQDHKKKDLLFAGTEFGLFFTTDGGGKWIKLSGGVPNIPFRDLEIQRRENDLVGATFGRGFYVFDDYSFLRSVSDEALTENKFILFPTRRVLHYVPDRGLGGGKGAQGDSFYVASNPPHGAVFTLYRRDSFKSKRDLRKEKEQKIKKQGGDVPTPSFEELAAEERDAKPELFLTVRDKDGKLVRRLGGPTGSGFHRVVWNMREGSTASPGRSGPLASPGRYTVVLEQIRNGKMETIGKPQRFSLTSVSRPSLPRQDEKDVAAFYQQVEALSRSARGAANRSSEALEQIAELNQALKSARIADLRILERTTKLEAQLRELREGLVGESVRQRFSEPAQSSILRRLSSAGSGRGTTYGPTKTHRNEYEIAAEQFGEIHAQLQELTGEEMNKLFQLAERAGIPWTTGRPIPSIKK
jgi:photosystem II stability/assembly factor-like uncharacterized protein